MVPQSTNNPPPPLKSPGSIPAGVDTQGGRGDGDWYFAVGELMEHIPFVLQFEKWNLTANCYTKMMHLSSVWLYFCHNIHNCFQFFKYFSSPKGGWLAT